VSPDGPRILFYSHNGVGIGHVYRQLTLAKAVRDRKPGADVLVVTGSHASGALPWPDGVEYLKLPAIRMVDRYENWVPRNLSLSTPKVMKLRSGLIREAVRRFAPDLLVADFIPGGPYGELLPALEKLRQQGGKAVAGFRDIVDEPAFVRRLWEKNGTYAALAEHYDGVCVYGSREVVDFERDYGLRASPIHYVGYLAPQRHEVDREDAEPFLLATTGGGADGCALLDRFIQVVQSRMPALGGRALVVGGPLLSRGDYKRLRDGAAGTRIEVKRTVANLSRLVQQADVVVTMAGYNTSCALLSGSPRAVVAPRPGPSQEQRLRSSLLERWGIGDVVPLTVEADALATAIERALGASRPGPPPVPLDGIARASDLLAQVAAR
jgi:predicted glycosyltransferase